MMRSQIRSVVVASTKCNSFSSPSSSVLLSTRFFDAQSSTTQAQTQAQVRSQVSYSTTAAPDDVTTSTTTNKNNPGTDTTTCKRRGSTTGTLEGITGFSSASSSSSNYNYYNGFGDIVYFTGKGISTSNNISRATPREVELILFHMQNSDF